MDESKSEYHQNDTNRDIEQPPAALKHTNQTVNDSTRADYCQQKKTDWPQYVEAACAILLVIITGTYTYYAAGQLHKLRRAVVAAEGANRIAGDNLAFAHRQFRMDERPYLSPDPRGIFLTPEKTWVLFDNTHRFGVCVTFYNRGKSPAIEVMTSDTQYKIGPKAQVVDEVNNYRPDYNSPPMLITTDSPITAGCETRQLSISEEKAWQEGDVDIYVVGGAVYKDMFDPPLTQPYETTYCWRISNRGMPFSSCKSPATFRTAIR
jgi:hypothetical protein